MTIASDGLSGTIVMAGDVPSTATIYVVPNYPYPAASGPSETVTLTLESGTGYTVMSGWTTATATVDDDYPWNSENPTTETRVTMVPFNPDGSQADPATTFTAPVGDFIPIGLGTLIAVSNPSTVWGILTYDESEFSVTDPNGDYIPSGEEISLAPAETIIDVLGQLQQYRADRPGSRR